MKLNLPFFNSSRGSDTAPVMSDERAQLIQPVGGRWYHAAKQGKLFVGNAAATGLVLPIFSATGQVFGLWNPNGSGVNAIIASIAASYIDTTGAAGGFCLAANKNIGSGLATGAISAFTEATPERAIGPGTGGNKVRLTVSAATTVAPVLWRQLGINQLVLTATDATNGLLSFVREFDGDCVVGQGCAVWLCGNIATLSKWAPTIVWAEEVA